MNMDVLMSRSTWMCESDPRRDQIRGKMRLLWIERLTHQPGSIRTQSAELVRVANVVRGSRPVDDFEIVHLKKSLDIDGQQPQLGNSGSLSGGFERADQLATQPGAPGIFFDHQRSQQTDCPPNLQTDQSDYYVAVLGNQESVESFRAEIVYGQIGS